MRELTGKVVVVTGGANGIGLAMARSFGTAGSKVVLADINPTELAEAVVDLAESGVDVIGMPTDVADYDQVEALRDHALAEFGAVHVVCNNAGVASGGACWEIDLERWHWVLGIDLFGVVHGVKAFTQLFIDQDEGHIVNTASMAGLLSPGFTGPYNVAKHGVVTLSETLFAELSMAQSHVGVSVLCPGWVNTRIYDSARYEDAIDDADLPDSSRPADEGASQGADAPPTFADVAKALVTGGIDPSLVGDQVVSAVLDNRFYVLTHPDWSPLVTDRTERIVDGRNPIGALLPTNSDDGEAVGAEH